MSLSLVRRYINICTEIIASDATVYIGSKMSNNYNSSIASLYGSADAKDWDGNKGVYECRATIAINNIGKWVATGASKTDNLPFDDRREELGNEAFVVWP